MKKVQFLSTRLIIIYSLSLWIYQVNFVSIIVTIITIINKAIIKVMKKVNFMVK